MSEAAAPAPVATAPSAAPAQTLGALLASEGAIGESPAGDESGGGDEVSMSRAEARKILFDATQDSDPEIPENSKTPKPEAKPETPKAEADVDVEVSKKWAKVRAQEDRLVKRQKDFAESQRAFEERSKSFEAREAKIAEREALLNDPIATMQAAGWDKDRIVAWIQGDGKVDPEILVKQLSDRHQKEMEELRAERQREREELENEKRTRRVESLRSELDGAVSEMVKDADFSLLQRFVAKKGIAGVQERVRDTIAKVWNQRKQAVDPRDVLVYLERELAEMQFSPGQDPAVKPANPAAVEPRPITNQATSQRTVVPQSEDDDIDSLRERSRRILRGEEE